MDNSDKERDSWSDIIRLFAAMLFGSGGTASVAVGMMQDAPDVRPWGAGIFVFSVFAAIGVWWLGERRVEKRRRKRLENLDYAYSTAFRTTISNLAGEMPQRAVADPVEQDRFRRDILDVTANTLEETYIRLAELQNLSEQRGEPEWLQLFKKSTTEMTDSWKDLARTDEGEGIFPVDALPKEL
ncbi:MAG TPA: hypothetical protein G4O15_04425 [Dehalococcoidia bacterium]|nr:hypothetical protein [Dehalococcoidia bacterium]